MFFIKNAFATVWHVDKIEDKYSTVRIGTSKKNQDGTYTNSNWFATFIGKAHDKIKTLEPKDRITIITGNVQNVSKKQPDSTYKTYLNVAVFDFEKQSEKTTGEMDTPPQVETADDSVPF